MNNKTIIVLLVWVLTTALNSNADSDRGLQIYLPREISIETDVPNIGMIAIMRGDEVLVGKAKAITLGRIASPGQKIIVDRTIILSRLACNGIEISQVTLTGAEEIAVSRKHQIITGSEFVKAASDYLKSNLPDKSICQINEINKADNLIIPCQKEDIKFSCSLVTAGNNPGKVRIAAVCDGNELGLREIGFRFQYKIRKIVTKVDIAAGTIISPENVKIEEAVSNIHEPADWAVPYGFIAKRTMPANTEIRPGMTETAKPKILLKRDQNVVIKISQAGLLITANGRTLQDGSIGQCIRVQNADSQRIIVAKVCEDGTVEPVF